MKLYKHENCTDTAIEILKSIKLSDSYKLKVSWWNIVNPNNKYPIGVVENLRIKFVDWNKWKILNG